MNWQLYTGLWANWVPAIDATVDSMIRAASGWVDQYGVLAMTAYLAFSLINNAIPRQGTPPVAHLEEVIVKCAVIFAVASKVALYTQYVRQPMLNELGPSITRTIMGATGNQPLQAAVFDDAWNKAFAAGMAVLKKLSWTDFALEGLVAIYLVFAAVSIGIMFAIYVYANVMADILVGVGPLFALLLMFPYFSGIGRRWFSSIIANLLLQVFAAAVLAFMLGVEGKMLSQILSQTVAGSQGTLMQQVQNLPSNAAAQTGSLLGCLTLFGICGWIAFRLPELCSHMAEGVAGHSHAMAAFALGAMSGVVRRAFGGGSTTRAGAAVAPNAPGGSGAPPPSPPAPGPSLSNGPVSPTGSGSAATAPPRFVAGIPAIP